MRLDCILARLERFWTNGRLRVEDVSTMSQKKNRKTKEGENRAKNTLCDEASHAQTRGVKKYSASLFWIDFIRTKNIYPG